MKTDLTETECEVVVWVHLVREKFQWRALMKMIMSLLDTQKAGFLDKLSDYQLLKKDSATWS
jgi:hypothetical protein